MEKTAKSRGNFAPSSQLTQAAFNKIFKRERALEVLRDKLDTNEVKRTKGVSNE